MVKISQLAFLIHQSKIPKVIELSYARPYNGEAVDTYQGATQLGAGVLNYKKLGHFSVDDNLKT